MVVRLFSNESKGAQFELSFEMPNLNHHSNDGILDRVYAKLHSDAWFELRNSSDGPDHHLNCAFQITHRTVFSFYRFGNLLPTKLVRFCWFFIGCQIGVDRNWPRTGFGVIFLGCRLSSGSMLAGIIFHRGWLMFLQSLMKKPSNLFPLTKRSARRSTPFRFGIVIMLLFYPNNWYQLCH